VQNKGQQVEGTANTNDNLSWLKSEKNCISRKRQSHLFILLVFSILKF